MMCLFHYSLQKEQLLQYKIGFKFYVHEPKVETIHTYHIQSQYVLFFPSQHTRLPTLTL
jgi:hypothetical protein